jgi:hypothetical protein
MHKLRQLLTKDNVHIGTTDLAYWLVYNRDGYQNSTQMKQSGASQWLEIKTVTEKSSKNGEDT